MLLLMQKVGGDMFSYTNFTMHKNGSHANTAEQRNNGGIPVTDESGQVTTLDTEQYYQKLGNANIASDFVEDASYVKLREVSFGYKLPSRWTEKVYVKGATLSFVGRNLGFIYNGMDGIDPESIVSRGMLGIEYAALPSSASYGFNLNLKF